MNKFLLISLCAIISVLAYAQEDAKYLAGAVPEVDGKVIFFKSIPVKNPISDDDLFNIMDKWANDNYGSNLNKDLDNRVLLSNPEEKDIACQGEKFLVFKKSAFVLDQAKMVYQLILDIEGGKCNATARYIKYEYSDSKTPLSAEEMITDKIALNKKGDKLNRYYDKFRRQTVDSINSIFNSIDKYLNGTVTTGVVSSAVPASVGVPDRQENISPALATATNALAEVSIPGFKKVDTGKIPASLQGSKALILSGSLSSPSVVPASWGGVTSLMERPVALSNVNTAQYATGAIDNAGTYTISFYTEVYADALKEFENTKGNINDKIKASGLTPVIAPSGAPVFTEAWMVIECKKAGVMPSSDPKAASDKTYLGEILNVWIK